MPCYNTFALQQRRNLASVPMLYKLQHQLVSISNLHYLVPSRDHKFIQPFSPTNYHLYSFFPRTIRLWNSLPNQVANSPDLDAFKSGAQLISLRLGFRRNVLSVLRNPNLNEISAQPFLYC